MRLPSVGPTSTCVLRNQTKAEHKEGGKGEAAHIPVLAYADVTPASLGPLLLHTCAMGMNECRQAFNRDRCAVIAWGLGMQQKALTWRLQAGTIATATTPGLTARANCQLAVHENELKTKCLAIRECWSSSASGVLTGTK